MFVGILFLNSETHTVVKFMSGYSFSSQKNVSHTNSLLDKPVWLCGRGVWLSRGRYGILEVIMSFKLSLFS